MTFLQWCSERADRARTKRGGPGYENDAVGSFCLDWILDDDAPRGWISELTFERYVAEFCSGQRQIARRSWCEYQDQKTSAKWSETVHKSI